MAICRRRVTFRPPSSSSRLASPLHTLVSDVQRWMHSLARRKGDTTSVLPTEEGSFDPSTWKTLDCRAVGIRRSAISSSAWRVLNVLRKKGFDAYLVGGCVRDLLLKRSPKDFDVITNATLQQVKRQSWRCIIVGSRFPICHVSVGGSIIEVSSFTTIHKSRKNEKEDVPPQVSIHKSRKNEKEDVPPQVSNGYVTDYIRWKNCLHRDFTINSLFLDPATFTIYDYVGGIEDLRSLKVRTVVPAHLSFEQDCARILRGLRIASRLGLQFSKETAAAIQSLSSSILTLGMQRLQLEVNFMLAYGAAVSSINLLQKFKLFDILFPIQAAYLADQTMKQVKQGSTMLMNLFSNADKLFAADHPANGILWSALLAFHLALVENPQDSLVVWTFSAILYNGTWKEAMDLARINDRVHRIEFVPEIRAPSLDKSDELIFEEVSHLAFLAKLSVDTLTSIDALLQSLRRYQKPSPSVLAFVSKKMGNEVYSLFDEIEIIAKSCARKRERFEINYERLKNGHLDEVRFVLGKIIMETLKSDSSSTSLASKMKSDAPPSSLSSKMKSDASPTSISSKMKSDAPPSSLSSKMKSDASPTSLASMMNSDASPTSTSSKMKSDASPASPSSKMKSDPPSTSLASMMNSDASPTSISSKMKSDASHGPSRNAQKGPIRLSALFR